MKQLKNHILQFLMLVIIVGLTHCASSSHTQGDYTSILKFYSGGNEYTIMSFLSKDDIGYNILMREENNELIIKCIDKQQDGKLDEVLGGDSAKLFVFGNRVDSLPRREGWVGAVFGVVAPAEGEGRHVVVGRRLQDGCIGKGRKPRVVVGEEPRPHHPLEEFVNTIERAPGTSSGYDESFGVEVIAQAFVAEPIVA